MQLHRNPGYAPDAPVPPGFAPAVVAGVRRFHAALPDYAPTPLHALPGLAAELDVADVWIKDEGSRFGLKAFKALGVTYALERIGARPAATLTLTTATDGNHGRAVAWAAERAGHRAVIFVPADASESRAQAIAAFGAEVRRVQGGYDKACEQAREAAAQHGWTLLQDTASPGYERVPRWIMQGYTTLADEALEQLGALDPMASRAPTHVFLQCGVGSFAAAVVACLASRPGFDPVFVLVEPTASASARAAFEAGTDRPPLLPGAAHTFMACLSCGQLSTVAWQILRHRVPWLLTAPDEVARRGMRRLATPTSGDPVVVSGESGAATAGALLQLAPEAESVSVRDALGMGQDSRILLVSTEGDTDPEVYRRTVDGS